MLNNRGRGRINPKLRKSATSQEIFENIRSLQPSKSETFTYVTFSTNAAAATPGATEVKSDAKKTMRESRRVSASSSCDGAGGGDQTTTPRSSVKPRKTSKTCQVRYVSSKIGSLDNIKHKPGGGNVTITGRKLDYSQAQSKCGSLQNKNHTPKGGNVRIVHKKPDFSNVQSKVGSITNHTPGGGKVKIVSQKKDYSKVQSKCGSLDNAKHRPGGGNVQIINEPIIYKSMKTPKKSTVQQPEQQTNKSLD